MRFFDAEMLSIPADTVPRELAGLAGKVLIEGSFDSPIVRKVEPAPCAVVEVRLYERDAAPGIAGRTARLVAHARADELGAGGQDPAPELSVVERSVRVGRVPAVKSPTVVERD